SGAGARGGRGARSAVAGGQGLPAAPTGADRPTVGGRTPVPYGVHRLAGRGGGGGPGGRGRPGRGRGHRPGRGPGRGGVQRGAGTARPDGRGALPCGTVLDAGVERAVGPVAAGRESAGRG